MSEDVEKILLAPVQVEFTDNVKKIRQNLMVTSFIALFITIGGIQMLDRNNNRHTLEL